MLKKHNKLIMLLVLVTFMFSIVGSAGAATFSDVTGTSVEAAAVYKLNSLGIIDGYPDGTFGPEKTITRAEFAKIACVTSGLKSVASGMGGTASPFSDVATDHWANGWINVAAAQGFVKGDPAGTFRPEDKITQAEVVTVLLRILGYNDNLPGEWPSDYIAKAANLGVLDDVTFVANQAATRGTVAVIAAATLDETMVTYKASDNFFDKVGNSSLLTTKFSKLNNVVEKQLVTDVDLSNGTVKLAVPAGNLEVDPSCVYVNATGWGTAMYRYIDYIYDTDKKAIVYIKVRDYEVVKSVKLDKIEVAKAGTVTAAGAPVNGAKIKVDGKTYTVAANFAVAQSDPAGVAYNFIQLAAGTVLKNWVEANLPGGLNLRADSADLVLNADGEVGFVKSNAWPTVKYAAASAAGSLFKTIGVIDEVNTKNMKITTKGQGSITLDKDDSELYYITLNGKKAELKDLQENDLVYELPTKYNVQFIVAVRLAIKGTLESMSDNADGSLKSVTVNGKKYDVAVGGSPTTDKTGGAYLSTDEGDTFKLATSTDTQALLGNEVTLMLNPLQKVGAIISTPGSSGRIYGVINDNTKTTVVNGSIQKAIEVALADGTFATYSYDKNSEIWDSTGAGAWIKLDADEIVGPDGADADTLGGVLANDVFVEVTLNSDGYIDQIKYGASVATAVGAAVNVKSDKDNKVVFIGTDSYSADKLIAFNLSRNSDGDIVVINTADFLDKLDSAAIVAGAGAFAKIDTGALKYLVVNGAGFSATSSNYCMIESLGRNSDGAFVNILMADNTTKLYQIGTGAFLDDTVFRYELSAGKINALAAGNIHAQAYTVDSVNGSIITLSGGAVNGNYYVDADTLYFDNTDDDPAAAALSDLAAGDKVKIYRNDTTGALDAVELIP